MGSRDIVGDILGGKSEVSQATAVLVGHGSLEQHFVQQIGRPREHPDPDPDIEAILVIAVIGTCELGRRHSYSTPLHPLDRAREPAHL
ncbi:MULTISPECIES: hypothetical protein [unclassified Gordonia (in: high G+C Gram-positive bacteria)]|uniref:hypothetical protein n=1 Tax=unclassified Gordonia (in: high G+C Gram-positive bacteria) TaxID=2657482 RepID=UPI0012E816B2|nr:MULTISPECIES: hypothetical protein [unclassified Gordonia (in: high G+C Gram-positive bacteria)]